MTGSWGFQSDLWINPLIDSVLNIGKEWKMNTGVWVEEVAFCFIFTSHPLWFLSVSLCFQADVRWMASPLTHSLLHDVPPQSEQAAVKPVCLRCNFWSLEPKENFSPLPYFSWVFSHGEKNLTKTLVDGLMNWLKGISWAILVRLVMEHPRGPTFWVKMSGVVLCQRRAGVRVLKWEYVLLDLLLLLFFFLSHRRSMWLWLTRSSGARSYRAGEP